MPKILQIFFVLIALAACQSAEAQVPLIPGRPFRGIFGGGPTAGPDRPRKELTTSVDVLAGYDDSLLASVASPASPSQPGYTGFSSAGLRYSSSREARTLTTTGRGYVNRYGTTPTSAIGGDFQIDGTTTMGKKDRLSVAGTASYEPFFRIGAFESLGNDVVGERSPDADPLNGIEGQHSWRSSGNVTFDRQWTRRNNTDVKYIYGMSNYRGASGFDSNQRELAVGYTRVVSSTLNIRPSYRHSEHHLLDGLQIDHRTVVQSVELGSTYQRRPSRTRSLRLVGGVGATQTHEFGPIGVGGRVKWTPTGHGSVDVGLGRTWAIGADYRRAISILDSISRRPLLTDATLMHLGGLVGRRLELILSSGYSAGRQSLTSTAGPGRFDTQHVSGEARFALARTMYMHASYTHFEERVNGFSAQQAGIPPQFVRNVVNVGVSLWVPLYGTWGSTQRPVSGRN